MERNLQEPERARLLERVAKVARQSANLSEVAYANARIACPFLVDQACITYENRPFDCQGYTSSDAAVCERALEAYDFNEIPIGARRYRAFVNARGVMISAAKANGQTGTVLELSAALHIAFNEPDVVERWLAGEPVFAPAEITDS